MRWLRNMFGSRTRAASRAPGPQAPELSAPDPLTLAERLETQAARRRLEPKWRAIDALLDDFDRGDKRLGLG